MDEWYEVRVGRSVDIKWDKQLLIDFGTVLHESSMITCNWSESKACAFLQSSSKVPHSTYVCSCVCEFLYV